MFLSLQKNLFCAKWNGINNMATLNSTCNIKWAKAENRYFTINGSMITIWTRRKYSKKKKTALYTNTHNFTHTLLRDFSCLCKHKYKKFFITSNRDEARIYCLGERAIARSHGERYSARPPRAYSEGLGDMPPVGSRDKAPDQGVNSLKLKAI